MLFPTFLATKYKTHTCRGYRTHELTTQVSSCVLYPLCVLYFTNSNCKIYLGRIKKIIREWRYFGYILFVFTFYPQFMLFPIFLETYQTHKGYRTHELTTHVCGRMSYQWCPSGPPSHICGSHWHIIREIRILLFFTIWHIFTIK